MPTTVRIPPDVLAAVDRLAQRRRVTRNRYILEALRARVEADQRGQRVPRELFESMAAWRADPDRGRLLQAAVERVRAGRRSKRPVAL